MVRWSPLCPAMVPPTFDRYYRYHELREHLIAYTQAYPQLLQCQSIGQSHEGRDIWLLTVTNQATGPAEAKPSLWVDGNIHSIEVAASTAALYLIHTLVTQYGQDPEITRCLDTRAFYICPRLNPDGAEWALGDRPRFVRSGTRLYPDPDPLPVGLIPQDMDGDGRILLMRIPDPQGHWQAYPADPRLMVPREPTATGGDYYRLLPEGEILNYDGLLIPRRPMPEGLDFNRNFPAAWRSQSEQPGAGPYPTSEPEVRAAVDFIAQARNLTGAISFHTMSGVLLRPHSYKSDEEMPPADLRIYKVLGEKGEAITGYPAVSVYHDFRTAGYDHVTGACDDWAYEEQGLFSWTVELWSPMQQVGIEGYHFLAWFDQHPLEDDLQLLAWSDRHLQGQGYIDWYPFDHPQLGPVELGGWNRFYCWHNPPPQDLLAEIAPFPQWLVWHLLISPLIAFQEQRVIPLGADHYQVQVVVQNTGWLPTQITEQALKKQLTRGCRCTLTLPPGATLIQGEAVQCLGELTGRSHFPSSPTSPQGDTTSDQAKAEWILHAPQGGRVEIQAQCDRAGQARTTLPLTPSPQL